MKNLRRKLAGNIFLQSSLVFIILGAIPFLFLTKGDMVKWINTNIASDLLDPVFINITHLGDGLVWLYIAVILLFTKYLYVIIAATTAFFNQLLSSLFKLVLFNGVPRPTAYFEDGTFVHLIEGFRYYSSNSFPSGHTMTAFAAAFLISYFFRNKTIGVIAFILALIVGFSRVYLLLHFYIDMYFGAILGLVCFILALLTSIIIIPNQHEVLSGSLLDTFKKSVSPLTG